MQSPDRFVRLTDRPSFFHDLSLGPNEEQSFNNNEVNETRKESKPEPVLPAFVRQIKNSRIPGYLTIFDSPTRLVVILGVLTRIDRLDYQLVYHIRDDTGSIKCFQYLEQEETNTEPNLPLNKYVKIKGVIRLRDNEPNILIVNCSPMKSLNELTSHLLEILLVAINRSKEKKKSLTTVLDSKGY